VVNSGNNLFKKKNTNIINRKHNKSAAYAATNKKIITGTPVAYYIGKYKKKITYEPAIISLSFNFIY